MWGCAPHPIEGPTTPFKEFCRMKAKIILWGIAAGIFILDQFTKWLVITEVPAHRSIQVIPGFFDIVNIRNRGAAFGFLNRSDIDWQFWLFLGATIMAVAAILILARGAKKQPLLLTGLGLVLGGAFGNLVDRLRWRAVVDFLDFYLGSWHWPAFNVADMGICVGAALICLATFIAKKDSSETKK